MCSSPVSTEPSSFLFQAEGGIRGRWVTGVQTCALPISTETSSAWGPVSFSPRTNVPCRLPRSSRSEERRVGKGVDLGGRRIIKKKKCRPRRTAGRDERLGQERRSRTACCVLREPESKGS